MNQNIGGRWKISALLSLLFLLAALLWGSPALVSAHPLNGGASAPLAHTTWCSGRHQLYQFSPWGSATYQGGRYSGDSHQHRYYLPAYFRSYWISCPNH